MTQDHRYYKRWRIERAQGIQRTLPAEPIRGHIQSLTEQVSLCAVAAAAGVSKSSVHNIAAGRSARVNRDIAHRILTVTLDTVYDRPDRYGFVPNVGARRRIQALMRLGWRHADMSRRLTVNTTSALILHQAGDWIARATHDAVDQVYEELSSQRGPSERTRQRAAKLGYLAPLWWDDDTIDDPTHDPGAHAKDNHVDDGARRGRFPLSADVDPVVVERLTSGNNVPAATRAEWYAAYAQLRDRGISHSAALVEIGASSSVRTLFADTYATRDDLQEATA